MCGCKSSAVGAVEVRACYSVSEMAELLGIDRKQAFYLLSSRNLLDSQPGRRKRRVWLSKLEEHAPEIFASLALVEALR